MDMEEVQSVPAEHTAQPDTPKKKGSLISILLLVLVLVAIPVSVIYLGNKTRAEIKAANECKTPPIPDPADCTGGDWKIYKNADGCVRFRCTPK